MNLKPKDRLTRHFDRLVTQAQEIARKYGFEEEESGLLKKIEEQK